MANKLFGKADPTLVNAALKHGLSTVPADMTDAYDAMAKTYGETNKALNRISAAIRKNNTLSLY